MYPRSKNELNRRGALKTLALGHTRAPGAVARCLDALFANVNWEEVNRRLERALTASANLRGTAT